MAARIFIGKKCKGKHKCASCGRANAEKLANKVLGLNFVDFDGLLISGGIHLCESCKDLLKDKDLRFKPVLYLNQREKQLIDRSEVLTIISNPPGVPFVLSLPYSFKKHHWMYAGLSTKDIAYIGTDSRTIKVDYSRYEVSKIILAVQKLISSRVPKKQISSGQYTVLSYAMPVTRELEPILAPARSSGLIELIVNYSTVNDAKVNAQEEDNPVLTKSEQSAVAILRTIARHSPARSHDGLYFWNTLYHRSITRYSGLDLKSFVSRLCDNLKVSPVLDLSMIELLTDDESEAIINDIRDKSLLLTSIAYNQSKKSNQQEDSQYGNAINNYGD